MKKQILSYASLFAVASMAFVGCNEVSIESEIQPVVAPSTFTITAETPASTQTKIGFTDNSSEGISLAWQTGDSFSVYQAESGEYVDDFTIVDVATSSFAAVSAATTLDASTQYIAVYPARKNGEATYDEYAACDFTQSQSQDSASLDHLSSACQMSDTFYGNQGVAFAHEKAILTITFATTDDATPTKLIFTDYATKSYELNFTSMTSSESIYTAHMMIDPVEVSAARTLDFTIVCDDDAETFSAESSVSYAAGSRYNAPINASATAGWTIISTTEELVAYLSAGTKTDAVMVNDIDLADQTYTPTAIGKTFDGNGYTIKNLTINNTTTAKQGLFTQISGTIKNLRLENPSITGGNYPGCIAGEILAAGTITNCSVVGGTVIGESGTAGGGGITGQSAGKLTNCSFEGTITAPNQNLGGVVGIVSAGEVTNCHANATVIATNANGGVGGIVGKSTAVTISDCTFSGSVSGTKIAGGILGCSFTTTEIKNCVNNGDVETTTAAYVGGIAGDVDFGSVISGCVNNGAIKSATNNAGGIVGYTAGLIVACYNTGSTDVAGTQNGGIAGQIGAASDYTADVIGCYNAGELIAGATNHIGYIIGFRNTSNELPIACYYIDGGTSQTNTSSVYGTACSDIAALNAAVEKMNAAILSSDSYVNTTYTAEYIFQDGGAGIPTLVAVE